MRNLQEEVEETFCYQKLFWPFTVSINCSRDLKNFANSQTSASNFKSFSRSIEHFFLTVVQSNFGNKIPNYCPFGKKLLYQISKKINSFLPEWFKQAKAKISTIISTISEKLSKILSANSARLSVLSQILRKVNLLI